MHIIYDDINWSTYSVPSYGVITQRRFYDHKVTLPTVKADDGYYYSPVATPKLSSPQGCDDPDYEYVDVVIKYDFDWFGLYSKTYNKELDKLLKARNSKGLPLERTYRYKGEKRPEAATATQNRIHDNSLVKMGINSNSIKGNSINGINRAEVEDAAGIVLGIASGIIEKISRSNNIVLAAANAPYEAQIAEVTRLVQDSLKAENAFWEELVQKKYGWLPDGSVKSELVKPHFETKAGVAAEIQEAGQSAIRDIKVEQSADEALQKSLTKAKWLSRAGKVITGAGYVIMFTELWMAYCEQDHQKFKEAVYGFIANFAAAAGAGAILGAKTGAMAGPKGIVVGIIIGVVIGVIDWAVLRLTDESLGHWIDYGIKKVCEAADYVLTTIAKPIAETARPGVNEAMRQMTYRGDGNLWDVIRSMGGGF